MPHIDKKSPLTYYLYGLLPDVLSGHDPQKRQLPGNLGFILHATDASLKAGHIIMPAAQTHETPEDVRSGLIMPHSSGAAAGFDFTELGSDAMGGIQNQLKYREVSALPGKIYGVDMNMTRATTIAPENIGGGIGTKALSGCTGILGCAELPDGSVIAYVSHVDPLADMMNRSGGDERYVTSGNSPSEAALTTFLYDAKQKGATHIRVVAAFGATAVHHPDYGRTHERHYYEWHFLDQIQNTLRRSDEAVQWAEKPYTAGSNLSLVVEHTARGNVITFGGEPVDFSGQMHPDSVS
jgi:hypothetical protein